MVEPPRISHKKKGDREREKERQERELADELEKNYKQEQTSKGRPPVPREALKRTSANNWVHLTCAVWTLETKFGDAKGLDLIEGIPQIPKAKYEQVCKICKKTDGACVPCHQCHATFHVGCAQQAGYIFGFDITPVKSSRRDSTNYVTFGSEAGQATAAIWCREHSPKTIIHYPNEAIDEQGTYALQRYVSTFKQADLTLTGTTRKANLLDESAKSSTVAAPVQPVNRRASTTTTTTAGRGARTSNAGMTSGADGTELVQSPQTHPTSNRICDRCEIDTSPRWFLVKDATGPATDGVRAVNGVKPEHVGDVQMVNGIADGAVSGPTERFFCQKCHWKRANGIVEPEPERKRDRDRDLTRSPIKPPVATHDPWGPANTARGPPVPNVWSHPPSLSTASSATLSQQSGPPASAPHGVYHPAGPIPPQRQHQPPPPQPTHGMSFGGPPTYRSSHPPPLTLSHSVLNQSLPNGLPSPSHRGVPQHSPTHPPPYAVPRSDGSPFGGPQRLPAYTGPPGPPGHHGSPPPPGLGRPTTPREPGMGGPPSLPREPSAAPTGGASASPSLRNLLH